MIFVVYSFILGSVCFSTPPALGCDSEPIPLMGMPFIMLFADGFLIFISYLFFAPVGFILKKFLSKFRSFYAFISSWKVLSVTLFLLLLTLAPIALIQQKYVTRTTNLSSRVLRYSNDKYGFTFLYPRSPMLSFYSFGYWDVMHSYWKRLGIIDGVEVWNMTDSNDLKDSASLTFSIYPKEFNGDGISSEIASDPIPYNPRKITLETTSKIPGSIAGMPAQIKEFNQDNLLVRHYIVTTDKYLFIIESKYDPSNSYTKGVIEEVMASLKFY